MSGFDNNGGNAGGSGAPLQFGLKLPLVLMLGLGVILAVYVAERDSNRRRRMLLEQIITDGGWFSERMVTSHNALTGPPPLRTVVSGSDPDLRSIAVAHLRPASATEALLDELSQFDMLQELRLTGPDVTDASLERLDNLKTLRYLYLEGAQVGGDDCFWLENYPELRQLDLRRTPVNDRALARIARLPRLEALWLDQTHITDEGLRHLNAAPLLSVLSLGGTRITDRGLENLTTARNLALLDITATAVRTGPRTPLPMDQSLRILKARNSQVNNEASVWLSRSSNLAIVDLSYTLISDDAMPAIRWPSLVSLDISESRARGTWLDAENHLPKLRHLKMTLDIDYEDRLPAFYASQPKCIVQAHRVVE